MESLFNKYINTIKKTETILYTGSVTAVKGLMIESTGPNSMIGELCTIHLAGGGEMNAEVMGFEGTTVKLMAYGETKGIEVGCQVVASGHVLQVPVGPKLLGRVIDATGNPYDGKGPIEAQAYYPVLASPPNPMTRKPNDRRISTGVRAIDSLLTLAKGQRMGIFAGSGVGKSSLLSTIARNTNADINVIGLVGERGREVMDFIEKNLGPDGMKRSVVVVATGDQSSICRLRAAYVTTAVAEYFRDQGKDVMLMMDSVTRFAKAQREIGLATGEAPALRGYPPSTFDMLPKLLERTGNNDKGTITAIYTVLVDGDDMDEPIADTVRGILDGHIVLNRQLAMERHYPAIDIGASISRLAHDVIGPQTSLAADTVSRWIALYESNKRMITAGAYQKGGDVETDTAIEKHAACEAFLTQRPEEQCPIDETFQKLAELTGIEIPEEEYEEDAARDKKSTAQLVHEGKIDAVTNANTVATEENPAALSDVAQAISKA